MAHYVAGPFDSFERRTCTGAGGSERRDRLAAGHRLPRTAARRFCTRAGDAAASITIGFQADKTITRRVRYMRMNPEQLAQLRERLDEVERLLVQFSAELKTLREQLHAAAPAKQLQKG